MTTDTATTTDSATPTTAEPAPLPTMRDYAPWLDCQQQLAGFHEDLRTVEKKISVLESTLPPDDGVDPEIAIGAAKLLERNTGADGEPVESRAEKVAELVEMKRQQEILQHAIGILEQEEDEHKQEASRQVREQLAPHVEQVNAAFDQALIGFLTATSDLEQLAAHARKNGVNRGAAGFRHATFSANIDYPALLNAIWSRWLSHCGGPENPELRETVRLLRARLRGDEPAPEQPRRVA